MDVKSLQTKITDFVKKYRYVAIILLVGVVLMMLPTNSAQEDDNDLTEATAVAPQQTESINEQLAQILSQIDGAGNVRVLLTVAKGEETIYQTDDSASLDGESSTTQVDTVIVTGSDKSQTGLTRQINPPTYLGAIIVCQGADKPTVQLAIVDAVSKVTGLGADRISVLKMK